MALRGMTAILIFASVAATLTQAAEDKKNKEDGRFFLTSTNTGTTTTNNNVVFDPNSIIYIGLIALGIFAVIALVGYFSEEAKEDFSYTAPSVYTAHTSPYGQAESSYAVLRSLDDAADKYQ
ncbi:uncharacterized protein LOC122249138 [Penaeus japonicus]|uniref:uncharacterized protein LOC122249138 n=1 Tax=Penaeus japonicus TaxID=27405 RepID=UPI001C71746E|nr:uncharacterized protein LOC122249138 [Penaeus japonicus]